MSVSAAPVRWAGPAVEEPGLGLALVLAAVGHSRPHGRRHEEAHRPAPLAREMTAAAAVALAG